MQKMMIFGVISFVFFATGCLSMADSPRKGSDADAILLQAERAAQHLTLMPFYLPSGDQSPAAWQLLIWSGNEQGTMVCKRGIFASYQEDGGYDTFTRMENCTDQNMPWIGFNTFRADGLDELTDREGGIAVVSDRGGDWVIWAKANNFYNSIWPVKVYSQVWRNPTEARIWQDVYFRQVYEAAMADGLGPEWTLHSSGELPEKIVLPAVTLDGGMKAPRTVVVVIQYRGQEAVIESD